jgi:hypothetical protein
MTTETPLINTPTEPVAPIAAPAVDTPVNAAPTAPEKVVETVPVAEAPSTTPIETPPADAPKAAETVLGEALDKDAPKTEDKSKESKPAADTAKAPTEAAPTAEATTLTPEGQSDDPAPPPTYDAFEVPEGITLDKDRVSKFTELLGKFEQTTKADHAAVQAFGQEAVNFHINEIQNAVTELQKFYQTAWDKQKADWKDAFMKDPEIGGNRFQTTVDAARNFIRTHGGTPEQQAEFRNVMETSGLGNHPAILRILANAGAAMGEGTPLANVKPVSQPKSRIRTMYGNS